MDIIEQMDAAHSPCVSWGSSRALVLDILLDNRERRTPGRNDAVGTGPEDRLERNGAAAKAGLNASLLRWGLGLIRQFVAYKAPRAGKHFVLVPAAYSSQECACCHHTSPLNRPSQAEFICQACGTTRNADHNGAIIITQRGYKLLSAGNRQTAPVERPKVAKKREAPCVNRG